jgi:hypothetical protein
MTCSSFNTDDKSRVALPKPDHVAQWVPESAVAVPEIACGKPVPAERVA